MKLEQKQRGYIQRAKKLYWDENILEPFDANNYYSAKDQRLERTREENLKKIEAALKEMRSTTQLTEPTVVLIPKDIIDTKARTK